jgi:hypothetical protein
MKRYILPAIISFAILFPPRAYGDYFLFKGALLDIDGQPLAFARIITLDKEKRPIGSKNLSDYEGRFNIRAGEEIASIIVVDDDKGVCMYRDGPWGSTVEEIVDLSAAEYHLFEGKIKDERKVLLRGVMAEGATWSGELDIVGRRLVNITAFTDYSEIITVNPDREGRFVIKANFGLDHLSMEVSSGGLYLREDGPWPDGASIEFDTSGEDIFIISGSVMSVEGIPEKRKKVTAFDARRKKMMFTYTDPGGRFEMRSNREVSMLMTSVGGREITEWGPWSEDTRIDIER